MVQEHGNQLSHEEKEGHDRGNWGGESMLKKDSSKG